MSQLHIAKYTNGNEVLYIPEDDQNMAGMTAVEGNARRYQRPENADTDIQKYIEKFQLDIAKFEIITIEQKEEKQEEKPVEPLSPEDEALVKNPIESLWMPQGRILVQVKKFKLRTRSGIAIEEPADNNIKTGIVLSASNGLPVKRGDHVLFTQLGGNVLRINYHRTANIENPSYMLFAGDVVGIWNLDPEKYYAMIMDHPEFAI